MQGTIFEDQETLAERNLRNYYKKAKKNKYWKRGYEAAKKGLKKDDVPYHLPPKVIELIRKRTKWLMGFEDWYDLVGKKEALKERKHLEKKQKKLNKKAEESYERVREKRKEHRHKRKHKHGKRKHKRD